MPFPVKHAHVVTGITNAPPTGGVGPTRWNDVHGGLEVLRCTADRATTSTTYGNVTDLTWSIPANEVCCFTFYLITLSSVATVGVHVAINGPAGLVAVNATYDFYTTATAKAISSQIAYDSTSGQPTVGIVTRTPAIFSGTVENGSTAGTMAIRLKAEAAGTVTIVRGSWGEVWHL